MTFITSVTVAELNLELPSNFNQGPVIAGQKKFYSSIEERQTGIKILRKLRRSGQYIEDPEISSWVRSVGNKLVRASVNSANPFYFLVSKKTSINAFATEGGVIVVNAGLILKSESEDEVAAVLAHEIAHVTQRHISRMKKKAKLERLGSSAALLAGALAASQDSQAGSAIINTTIATMAHRQLSYSREAESEADREGLRVLARAGYDPLAMARVLGKLEQFGGSQYSDIQEFLQNHPLTHKRVTDTFSRAKRMGVYKKRTKVDSFLYMREKLRAVTNATQHAPNSLTPVLIKYGKAQKLVQRKSHHSALKLLNLKSSLIPEVVLIAHLLNNTKQYAQTVNNLLSVHALHPNNKALMIPLVNAYLALGQPKKAWSLIKDSVLTEQTSLEFFETFQKVASSVGESSIAYYTSAQRNIRTANYKVARLQLRQAIKLTRNPQQQDKMKKTLQSIKKSIYK